MRPVSEEWVIFQAARFPVWQRPSRPTAKLSLDIPRRPTASWHFVGQQQQDCAPSANCRAAHSPVSAMLSPPTARPLLATASQHPAIRHSAGQKRLASWDWVIYRAAASSALPLAFQAMEMLWLDSVLPLHPGTTP